MGELGIEVTFPKVDGSRQDHSSFPKTNPDLAQTQCMACGAALRSSQANLKQAFK